MSSRLTFFSYVLVAVQFICIGVLVYLTLNIPFTLLPIVSITIGVAVGLWAVLTMRIGHFNIQPLPKKDSSLVTSGPYQFIRHPMYLAVLLAMLGIAFNINEQIGYILYIVLLIDLFIKIRFEEKLLLKKFPEYKDYMETTGRLLPIMRRNGYR